MKRNSRQKQHAQRQPDSQIPLKGQGKGYLFSPLVDWLFIANVLWPLFVLVDWAGGLAVHEGLLFWQIFFVTAPHRWITLVLVSVDHHHSQDRRWKFAAFAAAILVCCLCLQFGTGSLLCLGLVDYVWNAWHFSSQHQGVYRIYQRVNLGSESETARRIHKIAFRGFMLYVIARVAGIGWGDGADVMGISLVSATGVKGVFATVDILVLLIPVYFVCTEIHRWCFAKTAKAAGVVYLTSVMSLFTAMLLAAHLQKSQLVIQLALASAIFHSMEYMSIVTWSVRKHDAGIRNPLGQLSKTWFLFLAAFVLVIGIGNYLMSRGFFEFWVTANLIVAFWHYCFDGMIWKRRPQASRSPSGMRVT